LFREREDRCGSRIIHRELVEAAKDSALSAGENGWLADLFKALGDRSRLQILWALTQRELCVCDLAATLGASESAVSHQLRLLRSLRLVANRREGVVLYYRLADEHVARLIQLALEHVRE
jgi:DNA-binding transcriptional ArsR family regulator